VEKNRQIVGYSHCQNNVPIEAGDDETERSLYRMLLSFLNKAERRNENCLRPPSAAEFFHFREASLETINIR